MARSAIHVHTKLVDEPFFIDVDTLKDPRTGLQIGTIQDVEWIRLEHRTLDLDGNQVWEEAIAEAGFSSVQPLDSTMGLTSAQVAGLTSADRDEIPAPGEGYMFVAQVTVAFVAPFDAGAATGKRIIRRPDRIPASLVTAPAS